MKSTDLARKDRDLKKSRKKQSVLERKRDKKDRTVGDFINDLVEMFFYDAEKIYNIESSEEIFMLLEDLKEDQPEKQWNNILRKAIKKTKIKQKEVALQQLQEMGDILPD
ncbi:hypothetical protein EXM22_15420 [Oceanispirochaeta crateris]|jgi:hypothetical protein|uniref:Uncharacterized protein n=1 Tax=Oceanispirochaeta crateris TaxID=2518645 RepID=A0A5C1QQ20_9SPIO|nr:hypothetical protein [Oceanispirochaeta crateris]QEN09299.1 hypothetical protein EXM22_15420 [Oceanispirochaeta crateris]